MTGTGRHVGWKVNVINEVLAQQLDKDVQVGWFASEQKMMP